MQLVLFGFAINTDPKGLPTAVVAAEASPYSRSLVRSLETSGYFRVVAQPATEAEAEALMAGGDVQFVLHLPADFSRKLVRGERPAVLVEADATDPAATGNALAALPALNHSALDRDLAGPLAGLRSPAAAVRAARAPPLQPRGHHAPTTSCPGSWASSSP